MNKKFITLIYTCIFVFFFCEGNAQQFNNDDVKVEVLLSNAMLKSFSMDIKFINSIDYTIGDYLLLASSNQFYILGMGGIESLFKRQKQSIDAYTITSKGTLFAICRKELCVIDTNNVLSKLFTLPNNAMGIVSGSKGLYVFDKNNLNGESSIYIVFEDARHAKLITVPMPIRSLLESEENLFFSSENKLFCIDVKNKKITELYSFPKKEDRIISMANDSLSHALYFSTNESIYRIINNEIEIINTDFGGTLRYDGEGLLIFNPEKSLIVRLRNSLLYPPEIKKPAIPPIDPANYLSDEKLSQLSLPKLRQLVLQNRISEAVSGYSQLVAKQAVNLELLAEYAYALALSGAYDCALMNLDNVHNGFLMILI